MTPPPPPVREERKESELERERERFELAFEKRERALERVIVFFVFVILC